MAGYEKYKMSNNAVTAYENGEKPFSKWTKTDILRGIKKAVQEGIIMPKCPMEAFQKAPAEVLRKNFLKYSGWHHTSSYFNETAFYVLDLDEIESITEEELNSRVEIKAKNKKEECWIAEYLVWSGTRKHPKSETARETGTLKGNWFYLSDGSKKSIKAKGFKLISQVE